jgi:protein-L-isoaspartate(D-aspartate) O-methyltransferase
MFFSKSRWMAFLCVLMMLDPGCSFQKPGKESSSPTAAQDSIHWDRPRFTERQKERERMVAEDIENYPYYPIKDEAVLEAMRQVPRHKFVPSYQQESAYKNSPLSIGYGQTISQPFIVAHMTQLLAIKPGDKILEIGTGSGYQAAVLSELTPNVYSIEIVPELGEKAAKLLNELGYKTIKIRIGDGYDGWEEYAPFDGIIVTCAPSSIPEPLIRQLKPGGRIVIPVGSEYGIQNLVVVEKDMKGRIKETMQYPVRFVPMTGKALDR